MRVKTYRSVESLAQDSALVAIVEAVSRREVDCGGVPVTISKVQVREVLTGVAAPLAEIRQMGSDQVGVLHGLPLVQSGSTYLAFLTPEQAVNDAPNQYWPTGASGLFELSGTTALHLDPISALSKRTYELDEVRSALGSRTA